MRTLSILFLLVAASVGACRRKVEVGSPPPSQTPTPAVAAGAGGATPREAVELFMRAAKVQDLDAMSNIWGTTAGSVRSTMPRQEWEMREVVFLRCLRHDSWRTLGEQATAGGERVLPAELKYQDLTRSTNFTVTQGPNGRWFVKAFDIDPLQPICQRPI